MLGNKLLFTKAFAEECLKDFLASRRQRIVANWMKKMIVTVTAAIDILIY